MLKQTLSLLIAITISASGHAQEKFRAVHWGLEDGLAQAEVYHMLKDVNGFLWIGTGGGLSRFDGSQFKNYYHDPNKKGTINANFTGIGLVEDSLHNIWIGTDKGMFRYDIKADTFGQFPPKAGLKASNTYVFPIYATKDEIFSIESDTIVSAHNVVTFANRHLGTLSRKDTVGNGLQYSTSYFDARTNSIWFLRGSRDEPGGGLLQMSLKTGEKKKFSWPCYKGIPNHCHESEEMVYDRKRNCLWLNSFDGLIQFTLDDNQFHSVDAFKSLIAEKNYNHWVGITIDLKGRIWLATKTKGIVVYDPEDHSLVSPFDENSIAQKNISEFNACIYADRDGMIWSGFWFRKGIYQIAPFSPSVKHYQYDPSNPKSLKVPNVINFRNAGQGKFWIGSWDGLQVFDSRSESFEMLTEKELPGFEGKMIVPLSIDTVHSRGYLLAPDHNVYLTDIVTKKCTPLVYKDSTDQEIKINYQAGIRADDRVNGEFFIGASTSDRQSIFKMDLENGVAREVLSFPLNTFNITKVRPASTDYLFLQKVGDSGNMTYHYEKDKWVLSHSALDSIYWSDLTYNDKDSTFWVVSEKRLIHYRKNFGIIKLYTPADGVPDINIFSACIDQKNNLWFNTDRSIHQLNVETGVISTLSDRDGFQPVSFTDGPKFELANNGDLYLGGGVFGEGITRISPDKFTYTSSSPYLASLEINQRPFPLATGVNNLEALSLSYSQNKVAFETGVIDYYSKGKSHIRYQLQGLNDTWQYAPANYTIRYDGLSPGTYTLLVQASNAANEFIGPIKTLKIHISPPWWNTWWAYLIYAAALFSGMWAVIQFRSRSLRTSNLLLEEKVVQRTEDLNRSLSELKETQTQLIHSEKMASLGELTAGIAHEIQNPLNFVTNFSEVSDELLDDMAEEIQKGNLEEAKTISMDVKQNLGKILHHGKRADSIVKAMLQHSRSSSGVKEPTDINALTDEYLRLAYHGLRAKDKSFNATMTTDFDDRITKINVVPHEIGRVILNLITNAFYAVNEKKKQIRPGQPMYEPTVTVSTKLIIPTQREGQTHVLIKVKDNGNGIPKKVIDKIFQPFFTTKPPGEGNGLGLSLSYEIVKVHGGQLIVDTIEGESTEFTVDLAII